MSETNVADFLSKTISNFELDESLWDSNISNHFISREKDYFGREKLDDETIIDFLEEQSRELNIKVVLIETEDLNCTIFGREELFEMLAIPEKLKKSLLNVTPEESQKMRYKKSWSFNEFSDLKYQSFGSMNTEIFSLQNQRKFRAILNIPWVILQRKTDSLPEYCLVPMSKLRNMPREQYFLLLHFFNELQNVGKEVISSNDVLKKPKDLQQNNEDILSMDNLKRHGEKRKMPLEDGHGDLEAQPTKKMKLESDLNEERLFDHIIPDIYIAEYHCPVCSEQFASKDFLKAGFQT